MALDVEVGSFTLATAAGTQTVSMAGSFTPKAILFFATRNTADGVQANARTTIGCATGASPNAWAYAGLDRDNLGTTDALRTQGNGLCLVMVNDAGSGWEYRHQFVSFGAGEFTIQPVSVPSTAYRVFYLALGGSDITNAQALVFGSATATGDQDIDVGFTPDSVVIAGSRNGTSSGNTAHTTNSLGFAANDPQERGVTHWWSQDNVGTSNTGRYQRTNAIMAGTTPGTGRILEADLTDWLSGVTDGFRLNYSTAPASAVGYGYLALEGCNFKVGTITTVTNTNQQTESGIGFHASAGMFISFCNAASGSDVDDLEVSLGMFDGTNSRVEGGVSEDNVGTSNTDNFDDDAVVYQNYDTTQTLEGAFDIDAFNADGFTWTHTDADPSANEVIYWLIGALEGPALTISVSDSITVAETVNVNIEAAAGALSLSVSDSVTLAETVAADVSDPVIAVSDSITLAETVATDIQIEIAVSDSVAIAESVTADIQVEIAVSDSITIAETVAAELSDPVIAVSDSVTLAETVATDIQIEIAVSDSVTLAETVATDIQIEIAVSDSVAIAESVTADIQVEIAVSDSVTIAETVDITIAALPALTISVSDSVTVAETVDVDFIFEVAASDSVTIAEIVDVDFIFEIVVSDSIAVAEAVDAEVAYEIIVSDSVLITEAVAADVSDPLVSVSDSVTVAEAVDVDVIFEILVSDSITVAETVAAEIVPQVVVSDSITIVETVDVDFIFEIAVSDSIAIAEDVNVAIGVVPPYSISVSDSVTIAEAVEADVQFEIVVSDAVSLAETILAAVSAPEISVTDTVAVTEAVDADIQFEIVVSDSATIAETILAEVSAPEIFVTDTVTIAESVNALVAAPGDINVIVSDAILVSETTIAAIGLEIAVSDNAGVGETVLVNVEPVALGIEISFDNLDSWTQGVKVLG